MRKPNVIHFDFVLIPTIQIDLTYTYSYISCALLTDRHCS